ncbi:MAG: hypothetical protein M1833_002954 [Piccolia ochrophora]|nr:MAG: hypothetical protein M1833_002954 [Piccolia ochrophora]
MAATCIVCLGDLDGGGEIRSILRSHPNSPLDLDHSSAKGLQPPESSSDATVLIAHLLPCGHNLHDECLKPWVERANSCPICRKNFNSVELLSEIEGPVISSYTVEDRVQVADIDPSMIVDEVLDEPDAQPCPVCEEDNNEDVLLLCDGCDAGYHTYCVGLESVPAGHWYCEECLTQRALDPYNACPPGAGRHAHHASDQRTRGQRRRLRSNDQVNATRWARVWQSVWDRLNLDLDFPYDDDQGIAQYRRDQHAHESEQRDFQEWERRFEVAQRQGGNASRFRETKPALLNARAQRGRRTASPPESQEELRAWNAFEKAKEIDTAAPIKRKRKSRSATTSPAEPGPSNEPERKLKRPRTRRTLEVPELTSDGLPEPSTIKHEAPINNLSQKQGAKVNPDGQATAPSFLQSLLKEVETSAASDENQTRLRPTPLSTNTPSVDHTSPRALSSPGSSPTSSSHPSPRALSATPPPPSSTRPVSPLLPLTSRVEPIFPAPEFSPSRSPPPQSNPSKSLAGQNHTQIHDRQRARAQHRSSPPNGSSRSEDSSPTRATMSLAAKADIEKMVRAALKPLYHSQDVSKDEYTTVNRNVSRMLYDRVGDVNCLDQEAREGWERLATQEVHKAVQALRST